MVQRKGTREASGTRLMIDLAWTSKNVMPRNSGVSKVRVTARCSNSTGGDGTRGRASAGASVRNASHRIQENLEHPFASVKHAFEEVAPGRGRRTHCRLPSGLKILPRGI